ncbi:MAG: GAF domain-containing protein [Dehalococcoidia bacterium]|nr:GAF domain-containing protein [Dehalococcoidia bacterium]
MEAMGPSIILKRWARAVRARPRLVLALQLISILIPGAATVAVLAAHSLGARAFASENWRLVALFLAIPPIGLSALYFGWKMAAVPAWVIASLYLADWNLHKDGSSYLLYAGGVLVVGFVMSWAIARQRTQHLRARQALQDATRLNSQLQAQQQSLDERARRLDALYTISHAVNTSPDLDAAMRAGLEATARALDMDTGVIYRYAPATKRLLLVYFHNLTPERVKDIRELDLGQGVVGYAAMTREPIAIEDPDTYTGPAKPLAPTYLSTGKPGKARVAIPLVVADEIVGVLGLGHSSARCFSPEDMAFLKAVGDDVSTAIDRAGLIETAIRETTQSEALARQSREMRERVRTALRDCGLRHGELLESRFPYLAGSAQRIHGLADRIARRMGLPDQDRAALALAAVSKDVGLLAVPDGILMKPGTLNAGEWAHVWLHAPVSAQCFQCVSTLGEHGPSAALPIVRHHHERWDGTGYPDGLRDNAIPLGARVLAVADAYDSLTHDRPHRRRYSQQEAQAILHEGAGSQWDPTIVATLGEILADAEHGGAEADTLQ